MSVILAVHTLTGEQSKGYKGIPGEQVPHGPWPLKQPWTRLNVEYRQFTRNGGCECNRLRRATSRVGIQTPLGELAQTSRGGVSRPEFLCNLWRV